MLFNSGFWNACNWGKKGYFSLHLLQSIKAEANNTFMGNFEMSEREITHTHAPSNVTPYVKN